MRLDFLGVRGSTPAPGAEFVRYGGHTSCVAITADGDPRPTLVLDAGTGIRRLPQLLSGEPYRGSILLSHLHWDHMQGIPFCPAVDRPDAEVRLVLPAQDGRSGRDLLAQSLAPPAFPITPEGLRGRWDFVAAEPGPVEVPGFDVRASEVEHKGGRTFGYRIALAGRSLAYVPDHVPSAGVSADTLDLLSGVDVLLHDAQFVEAERTIADLFGHATIGDAIDLAQRSGVGTLVLFHHGPGRTDDALDAIAEDLDGRSATLGALRIVLAREGGTLELVG